MEWWKINLKAENLKADAKSVNMSTGHLLQHREAERKGEEIYMCKALEEWEEKIRQEERQKERQESIRFNTGDFF